MINVLKINCGLKWGNDRTVPIDGAQEARGLLGSWQIVTLSCVLRTQTAYAQSQRLNIRYMKIVPIFKE